MDYYGTEPSSDFFAHYGVRGMKWGVRKAIDKHSEKRLDRQYRKAQKKLEKLNSRADVEIQGIAAKKHARRAIAGLGVGYAGLALGGETDRVAKGIVNYAKGANYGNYTNYNVQHTTYRKKKVVGGGKGIHKEGEGLGIGPVGTDSSKAAAYLSTHGGGYESTVTKANKANPFRTVKNISTGLAIAGLGTAAYQTGKAIAAKRRTTEEGHAKAVAKRDAWRKEMQNAFTGTKYDNKRRRKK